MIKRAASFDWITTSSLVEYNFTFPRLKQYELGPFTPLERSQRAWDLSFLLISALKAFFSLSFSLFPSHSRKWAPLEYYITCQDDVSRTMSRITLFFQSEEMFQQFSFSQRFFFDHARYFCRIFSRRRTGKVLFRSFFALSCKGRRCVTVR